MNNILQTSITVIVTFITTFILNLYIDVLTSETGNLTKGSYITIDQKQYQIFTLDNFSKKTINELELVSSISLSDENIISSTPLTLTREIETVGDQSRFKYVIGGFPSRTLTTFMLPAAKSTNINAIEFTNLLEINIKEDASIGRVSATTRNTWYIVWNSVIYSILIGIAVYIVFQRLEERNKKIAELKERVEKHGSEIKEIEKVNDRMRILLLSKLNDYSKELSFWRDTIRKIIYKSEKDLINSENLFSTIRNSLGTFSTNSNAADDFQTINALANLLSKEKVK